MSVPLSRGRRQRCMLPGRLQGHQSAPGGGSHLGEGRVNVFIDVGCSNRILISIRLRVRGEGVAVTLFDSDRGADGRMAQRREVMEDGTELRFDHGAPYFTVSNGEVARVVGGCEARGMVAEWKATFAWFDLATSKFTDFEKEGTAKKFVGVPAMNSICNSLCVEDGVVAKFGVIVGKMDWLQDRSSWSHSIIHKVFLWLFWECEKTKGKGCSCSSSHNRREGKRGAWLMARKKGV